jgi:peptidyl-prolyl cis-trans isomerase SurA
MRAGMDVISPLCRLLLAAGLLALVGCQSGGSTEALNARGQAPDLPAPIPPTPLALLSQPQPMPLSQPPSSPPINSSIPTQGIISGGMASPYPPTSIGPTVPALYVRGAQIESGVVTPVAMVQPSLNGPIAGKAKNPPRDNSLLLGMSIPQVKVVALVGTTNVITDKEVIEAVHQRVADYKDLPDSERARKEKELYTDELRLLIERELLIDDMFTRLKKNKKDTDNIKEGAAQTADDILRGIQKKQGARTEEEFIFALGAQGMTLPVFRRQIERQMMADEYVREVLKDTGKTPGFAEIRRYYDLHAEQFKVEDRVRWQDIFIRISNPSDESAKAAACAHAEKVLQMAIGGIDFISLIKTEEKSPPGRQNWDGIGTTRQDVPHDVAPMVWSLAPGQISGIISTPGGFHIVKVLEREFAGLRPFDEKTQNECTDKLKREYREADKRKMVDDLWRKGAVQIFPQ